MRNRPVIDYTRVAEGFLFDTHLLRCQYLGKTSGEKPRWLEEHKGQFQRLEDILRESAQLWPPDNIGAAPTELSCETSSPVTRKDADDDDSVSLVGTAPELCSPPCQPDSVPAPVNENVRSGSTQAELLPDAEATTKKTKGPKTETTALGAMGRKQGRGGGRKKQKLPAETSKARQKRYECMRVVLDSLREYPVLSDAAKKAGIHRKTLENWRKRSEAGDDGYDIEWQGWMSRFHEHCEWAKKEAEDYLLAAGFEIAKGVVYKYDEALLSLGFEGPDAYARDQNGNPIPEVIFKPRARGKMIRSLLEWRDKYGNHPKIDVPQQGGIVVVDVPFAPRPSGPDAPPPAPPARERRPKKIENSSAASVKVRKWKSLSRMIRKAKV
jgi:hypothetical protein